MSNESALDKSNKRQPVTLTETDCKALLQRCEEAITDICEECHYDITNIKPINWGYIATRIGQDIFSPIHYVVQMPNASGKSYVNGRYLDENILLLYTQIYRPLCLKYGQIVCSDHFLAMISVESQSIMHMWERRGHLTSGMVNLHQILVNDRERTLSAAMLSSNHNPVKFLAIGNHEFAWNETKRQKPIENKPVLSLSEVPDLTGIELSNNIALPDFGDDE